MKLSRLIVSSLLFIMTAIPLKAFAHPPKDIVMEFDTATKILKVQIIHQVKPENLSKHFIIDVKVFLDTALAVEQHFKSQTSNEGQNVSYCLTDAKLGTKIRVEAKCSLFGVGKKELVVSAAKPEEPKTEPKTEGK